MQKSEAKLILNAHLLATAPAIWHDCAVRIDGVPAIDTILCIDRDGMQQRPWLSAQIRLIAIYHIVAMTIEIGPVFQCYQPVVKPLRD